jgi:hypothetical protein
VDFVIAVRSPLARPICNDEAIVSASFDRFLCRESGSSATTSADSRNRVAEWHLLGGLRKEGNASRALGRLLAQARTDESRENSRATDEIPQTCLQHPAQGDGGAHMRRHHEELAATPSLLPALALLIPFAGALWARVKTGQQKNTASDKGDL